MRGVVVGRVSLLIDKHPVLLDLALGMTESKLSNAQSTEGSEQRSQDGAKRGGRRDGVCAFCQDDDEVMMCPMCSCRACFGKQDPSLALLCEVRGAFLRRRNLVDTPVFGAERLRCKLVS